MWPNQQKTGDLVTFTEEILDGKLQFLCGENSAETARFHNISAPRN